MYGFRDEQTRTLVGGLIVFSGITAAALSISHTISEEYSSLGILLDGVLPVALSLAMVWGGIQLSRWEYGNDHAHRVGQWWFLGVVVAATMGVALITYQRTHGIPVADSTSIMLNNAIAGGVGGLFVGYYEARVEIQADQLAEQRRELELLNRIVRHDVRNDLTIVLGLADLLEAHVDDETGREYLEKIQRSASEAVDLTETAREFVTAVTEGGGTRTEPTSLSSVLSRQVVVASDSFPDATISRNGNWPDLTVLANEMLASVFRNLLANAVQHNDVDDPEVTVSLDQTGDTATVKIADNGPGVRDEMKEQVFGRGEKGMESTGSGIGLYLVDTLVDGYDGRCWVEDNDPNGAVFVVELPLA